MRKTRKAMSQPMKRRRLKTIQGAPRSLEVIKSLLLDSRQDFFDDSQFQCVAHLNKMRCRREDWQWILLGILSCLCNMSFILNYSQFRILFKTTFGQHQSVRYYTEPRTHSKPPSTCSCAFRCSSSAQRRTSANTQIMHAINDQKQKIMSPLWQPQCSALWEADFLRRGNHRIPTPCSRIFLCHRDLLFTSYTFIPQKSVTLMRQNSSVYCASSVTFPKRLQRTPALKRIRFIVTLNHFTRLLSGKKGKQALLKYNKYF